MAETFLSLAVAVPLCVPPNNMIIYKAINDKPIFAPLSNNIYYKRMVEVKLNVKLRVEVKLKAMVKQEKIMRVQEYSALPKYSALVECSGKCSVIDHIISKFLEE